MKGFWEHTGFFLSALLLLNCINAVAETAEEGEITFGEASPNIVYMEFECTAEVDAEEKAPEGIVLTIIDDTIVSYPEHINAINQYLKENGYQFAIELGYQESFSGDFLTPVEIYKTRKEEGMAADIFFTTSSELQAYCLENGYLLNLSPYLESETGRHLLDALNAYYTRSEDNWVAEVSIEALKGADGGIYAIPACFEISNPYVIYYNKELSDVYPIAWTNTVSDLSILAENEQLKQNGVIPVRMEVGNSFYEGFFEIAGYQEFAPYWAVSQMEDGTLRVVDFLEDETLKNWYLCLGQYREAGVLGYGETLISSCQSKTGIIKTPELRTTADTAAYCMAVFVPNEAYRLTCGYVNSDPYGTAYLAWPNILNVETCINLAKMGIGVDAETQYPEECLQFLDLLYSDMEFRNLVYSGIEGWSYYVDDTSKEEPFLVHHTRKGGIMGLGLGTSCRALAELSIPFYETCYEAQLQANAYVSMPLVDESAIDLSAVQKEYDACMELYDSYAPVFWGMYGAETEVLLEELHEKVLEAGLEAVLEEMNRQLAE